MIPESSSERLKLFTQSISSQFSPTPEIVEFLLSEINTGVSGVFNEKTISSRSVR
jgi:hypothetical protein